MAPPAPTTNAVAEPLKSETVETKPAEIKAADKESSPAESAAPAKPPAASLSINVPPPSLASDLEALLSSSRGCDVTLLCGDSTKVKVHSAVLSARSPVFCALLADESALVEHPKHAKRFLSISSSDEPTGEPCPSLTASLCSRVAGLTVNVVDGIDKETLGRLLAFLYNDDETTIASLNFEDAEKLLAAAAAYQARTSPCIGVWALRLTALLHCPRMIVSHSLLSQVPRLRALCERTLKRGITAENVSAARGVSWPSFIRALTPINRFTSGAPLRAGAGRGGAARQRALLHCQERRRRLQDARLAQAGREARLVHSLLTSASLTLPPTSPKACPAVLDAMATALAAEQANSAKLREEGGIVSLFALIAGALFGAWSCVCVVRGTRLTFERAGMLSASLHKAPCSHCF